MIGTIKPLQGAWAFTLQIHPESDATTLTLRTGETDFLTVKREGDGLTVDFSTTPDTAAMSESSYEPPAWQYKVLRSNNTFTLRAPSQTEIRFEWHHFSARLFQDGLLTDEEWPLGILPKGDWTFDTGEGCDFALVPPDPSAVSEDNRRTFAMQYYRAPGLNTGVGDCMPYARDGRWCLYYLFDRRGHRSKCGLGAHQFAQISTADLKTWTEHPLAIGITEQWEGSICTGSLIEKDGTHYAFYAVRMSDGSPAKLTCARSQDGVHFTKSGQYFSLRDPYEPVSARDPKVFLGVDQQYHMLVTTSLTKPGRYQGCLAHLVSRDLLYWDQLEPFIVPGYADQPECSDYFEWNGWYYLVFSNFGTARYRMSRQPFGAWQKPTYDILDSVENQVPKTALFQNRRLITGFLARMRPKKGSELKYGECERSYAGNAITHELFQRDDGTLGVKVVDEIMHHGVSLETRQSLSLTSDTGRLEQSIADGLRSFHLKGTLSGSGCFGLTLAYPGGQEHIIEFSPSSGSVNISRPGQDFVRADGRNRLENACGLSGKIGIDLTVVEDIFDLVFSNGQAMVMRLIRHDADSIHLSAFARDGGLLLSDIELTSLEANVSGV
ncbi:hypothetical protein AGMMS49992_10860 [Clostridia bacterium]|nr:hypothetical protein AGMMS49992_10860 [Clostridia bacterium]